MEGSWIHGVLLQGTNGLPVDGGVVKRYRDVNAEVAPSGEAGRRGATVGTWLTSPSRSCHTAFLFCSFTGS